MTEYHIYRVCKEIEEKISGINPKYLFENMGSFYEALMDDSNSHLSLVLKKNPGPSCDVQFHLRGEADLIKNDIRTLENRLGIKLVKIGEKQK